MATKHDHDDTLSPPFTQPWFDAVHQYCCGVEDPLLQLVAKLPPAERGALHDAALAIARTCELISRRSGTDGPDDQISIAGHGW